MLFREQLILFFLDILFWELGFIIVSITVLVMALITKIRKINKKNTSLLDR